MLNYHLNNYDAGPFDRVEDEQDQKDILISKDVEPDINSTIFSKLNQYSVVSINSQYSDTVEKTIEFINQTQLLQTRCNQKELLKDPINQEAKIVFNSDQYVDQQLNLHLKITDNRIININSVAEVGLYLIAAACNDCTIKVWNIVNGNLIQTLIGHHSEIYEICTIKYGQILASGSSTDRCSIKIWDFISGLCLKTLMGHGDTITGLIKLSDSLIASSSIDSHVKIWDWKQSQLVLTLSGHNLAILAMLQMAPT